MAPPPKPSPHRGRCGWSQSPRTSSNDVPPSALRHSACGSVPAQTTSRSCGSAVICQMRASAAPVSSGKLIAAPSGRSCQVAPRSSECITVGPQCSDRTPASSRTPPSRGTKPRLGTSRMRNCGPSTDQCCRSSLRASHSPLRVPTATTVLPMAGVWPQAPTPRNASTEVVAAPQAPLTTFRSGSPATSAVSWSRTRRTALGVNALVSPPT